MSWLKWLCSSLLPAAVRRFLRERRMAGTVGDSVTPCRSSVSGSLSIVLGSYNRLSLLKHAINSVRTDAGDISREIIVVDGGSTDGSLDWLISQRDIVTIVQHNRGEMDGKPIERRSWGYFMNLAFKAAQGEWVLMLSDDCLLLPGAIPRSLADADRVRQAGGKVGAIAYQFRNWPQENHYYVQKTIGGKLTVNHGLFLNQALREVGYANEDDYVFYKADGDLNLRIWAAGYEVIAAEQAFVEHYLDPAEAVRLDNNAVLNRDRAAFHRLWPELVDGELPSRVYSSYRDPTGVAERVFGAFQNATVASA